MTLAAVTLNTAILIISYALMDGLVIHMVLNATNLVVGEAQVHDPEYLSERSFYKSIDQPEAILQEALARGIPGATRSYGFGLVSRGTKSAGALFWGVNPSLERSTFDLVNHLGHGHYLTDVPQQQVVIGKKLARALNASVGSELVVLVQAADGSLGNDLYTVSGILKSAGESLDRSAAIIHAEDFHDLFVSGGRIHEVAFNGKGEIPLHELTAIIKKEAHGTEVKSWRELMPMLSDMVNLFDASIWIFGLIFFLAAGLGVMNTMLMATFERIREFGIMKALGASPWRILRDVAVEAMLLALVATALGSVLGVVGSYYFEAVGLDTSSFAGETSFGGVAFDPIWRAVLSTEAVLYPVICIWIICIVSSLYPAALAARIDPIRAIHRV